MKLGLHYNINHTGIHSYKGSNLLEKYNKMYLNTNCPVASIYKQYITPNLLT